MTSPQIINIVLEQGTNWIEGLIWENKSTNLPNDLTGYTARLQVREKYDDPLPFLEMTTANNGIILGNNQGTIDIVFIPATTSGLTILKGYYELMVYAPGGQIIPLAKGTILIRPALTV